MRRLVNFMSLRMLLVIILIHVTLLNERAHAGQMPLVQNVRHEQKEDKIIISYHLFGSYDIEYDISLVLKKKSDPSYSFYPEQVRGDIGTGKFAGNLRKIEWNYSLEFTQAFTDDFYFEVFAEEYSGVSPWIWAGGAVVVGGVVFLLTSKSAEEEPNVFPVPPGRP